MPVIDLLIYLIVFTAATLLVLIPVLRWTKYNMSMVRKQQLTKIFAIFFAVMLVTALLFLLLG